MPAEQPSHLVSKVETRLPFGRSGERDASGGTGGPGRRLRRRRPSQVRGFPPSAKSLTAGPGSRAVTRPRRTRRDAPAGGRFTRSPVARRGRRAPHGRRASAEPGPDRTGVPHPRQDGAGPDVGARPPGTGSASRRLGPSMAPPPVRRWPRPLCGPQLTRSSVQLSNLATVSRYGGRTPARKWPNPVVATVRGAGTVLPRPALPPYSRGPGRGRRHDRPGHTTTADGGVHDGVA